MKSNNKGFTLVELMVVLAIMGILAATAMPLYRTFQQRAYGAEAILMSKQIIEAQIMYFLENDEFFPKEGDIVIFHSTDPNDSNIDDVKGSLNITIPVGHFLDYRLTPFNTDGDESFSVTIDVAVGFKFPFFAGGYSPGSLTKSVDKNGKITTLAPEKGSGTLIDLIF